MNELAEIIANSTGTSMAASAQAVSIMIGYLDCRLPPPIAVQVNEILRLIDKSNELSDRKPLRSLERCT